MDQAYKGQPSYPASRAIRAALINFPAVVRVIPVQPRFARVGRIGVREPERMAGSDLCVMVRSAGQEPGINHWPPILGLYKSVVVALTYMRRNRVQAEPGSTRWPAACR